MQNILEGLNPAQKKAVETTEGIVRVVAGAGSGKTRALTHRVAHLLQDFPVDPDKMLCVTFTNKAAGEMKKRIEYLTGLRNCGTICTFHSFCARFLREHTDALCYPTGFMILDDDDKKEILKIVLKKSTVADKKNLKNAIGVVEKRKRELGTRYCHLLIDLSDEELAAKYELANSKGEESDEDKILYGYMLQQKNSYAFDFHDLLAFTLYLLETRPDIKEKWQDKYEYISVDEFQDVDLIQYQIVKILSEKHGNLFVVGDSDQTIYSWRGADVHRLVDFDKDYENVKTILMNDNYRSTPEIIDVANSLIGWNEMRIKKELVPNLENGEAVECYHADAFSEETLWVASKIKQLIVEGYSYKDIAILYRHHGSEKFMENALIRAGIPYVVYGGTAFYGRKEIKDILSYVRMIVRRDDVSFRRIINLPARGIGEKKFEMLEKYARSKNCSLYEALLALKDTDAFLKTQANEFIDLIETTSTKYEDDPESMTVSRMIRRVLSDTGYFDTFKDSEKAAKRENIAELLRLANKFQEAENGTAEDFLANAALLASAEDAGNDNKVKMMTVHASKGLEFPCVFLFNMTQGIFPLSYSMDHEGLEEERRLAFVAVTRAEERLFISESRKNDLYKYQSSRNRQEDRAPSQFITEIEDDLLLHIPKNWDPEEKYTRKPAFEPDQFDFFDDMPNYDLFDDEPVGQIPVGTRVRHELFGEGTITGLNSMLQNYTVFFDALKAKRTIAADNKLYAIQ